LQKPAIHILPFTKFHSNGDVEKKKNKNKRQMIDD